jgi:hypothetical protein
LQPLRLLKGGLVDGSPLRQVHQPHDDAWVVRRHAVDDARRAEVDDGPELLPESAEQLELGVVDLGIERHLDMVRDVSVGPGT